MRDPLDQIADLLERERGEKAAARDEVARLRLENHSLQRRTDRAEGDVRRLIEENSALRLQVERAEQTVSASKRAIVEHAGRIR